MSEGDASSKERLEHLLEDVGRQLQRTWLGELFLGLATSALGALLLGTLLIAGGSSVRVAGGLTLILFGGAVGVGLAIQAWRWRSTLRGPLAVARWLDRRSRLDGRKADVTLIDAVELGRDQGAFGESPRLQAAAIDVAARFARSEELPDLARKDGAQRLSRWWIALVSLGSLCGLLALGSPEAFVSITRALTTAEGLEQVLVPDAPEPRLGDIRINYRYPEYSGRPPRTVVSSTGRIRGLPGTEVTVETRARQRLKEGIMVINYGDFPDAERSDEKKIAADIEGRRIRARFVLSRRGRYRFELQSESGERLAERQGHTIDIDVDDPPTVTIFEPKDSPMEVNARDRIRLVFEASDDFALGAAQVAWRVLGTTRQGKLALTEAPKGKKRFAGAARFNLRRLKLKPGDRVAYSVEVFDNDTIGGPKVGASATKELRVYSKKSHHEKAMGLEMAALDSMVHLLGDSLEKPFQSPRTEPAVRELADSVNSTTQAANETIEALEAAAKAASEDPLGRENIDAAFDNAARELQRHLGSMRRAQRALRAFFGTERPVTEAAGAPLLRSQERVVGALERHAVYISDLIDDQRMIDAEALARELREQQLALRDALAEYKREPTAEKRERIAQAIDDIKKRIEEIMSELAKLRSEIPQDFVNADALQNGTQGLDSMRQKLDEGDLDGALQELERMLNRTERMLSQLREGRGELQSREYSEITQRADKLWNDLKEVQGRQQDLANRTEKIANEVRERSTERLGNANEFLEEQLKRLKRAAETLEKVRPERHMPDSDAFELAERRVADGRQALEARDFGAAKNVLDLSLQQMETLDRDARRREEQAKRFGDVFGMGERAQATREALDRAEPLVRAVIEAIEKLTPDPNELLAPEEKKELDRFSKEQEALSEKAEEIRKELEALGEQLPIVGPEVRSALDDAQTAMGESGRKLTEGDAPGAVGQERRAVEALDRLSQQLEEMGSQSGGGQGGSGVPLPFGQPKGRLSENERGGQGRFNRDRVEIPKPETYQAPSEFREDILEAAKQGTVESYREAVRRYYEELVK